MVICTASTLFCRRFACCRVWALLLVLLVPAQAADLPGPDPIAQAQAALDRIQARLASADVATEQELKAHEEEIATIRSGALVCVEQAEQGIAKLESELAILRPKEPADKQTQKAEEAKPSEQPTEPVAPAIASKLQNLQNRKADLEARLATCKLIVLSSDDLQSQLNDYQRHIRTKQLLVRGPTLVAVVRSTLEAPERWLNFTTKLAEKSMVWDVIQPAHLGGAAVVGLLGFILGRMLARRLRARAGRIKVEEQEVSTGLMQAVIACGVSYAPILLTLGGLSAYLTLVPRAGVELPLFINLIYGLLAYFVVAAGIRTLFDPCPPATHYLPLPETGARLLARRSRMLALVVLVWWFAHKLYADDLLDETMFVLTRQIIAVIWVLNVIWIIWLLGRLEHWRDKWTIRVLLSLALLSGSVASVIGYMNMGRLMINGITNTLVLFGLALALSHFLSDLFDGLDEGRYRWQKALRKTIGLKGDEYVPGLGWLRLFVSLALWSGVVLLILDAWGAGEVTSAVLRYFTEGFQVAGLNIVPSQVLWAILALAVLLTLTRWVKGRLDSKWLTQTRMERSAREALVTTFGYVAMALSVVVALSIAGITFTNIAIIAGALSVGIGFGLQNVVNNFVSGLIMLVERPVRTGDWVVVGGTEGYVQRISIRTTTIRTFERADVIVPNSDLISGQVTNWTLRNLWGRITVPVGVAYGSNTATVKEILLEIANNNADVIKGNPSLPDPFVLFRGFGDSSLNFELRAIIRDVDRRLSVISDINFAIDAAFRQQGIEIPFPQRDVNLRAPLQIEHDPPAPRAETRAGDPPQA